MRKKIELQGYTRLRTEYPTDPIKYVFHFAVVDASFVGTPREKSKSSIHKMNVEIPYQKLVNWRWMRPPFELTISETILKKVLFWYSKELIEEKVKHDDLNIEEELQISDDYCPFEPSTIPDFDQGFSIEVNVDKESVVNETDTHLKTEEVKRLIHKNSRALQKLKEQQASFGPLHTPTHILLEIEDREAEIERLQEKLKEIEAESKPTTQQKKRGKPIRAKIFADVDIGNIRKGDATVGLFGSGTVLIEAVSNWASLDPKHFDYSWFLLNTQKSRQSIDDLDKLSNNVSVGNTLYLSNRFG